MSATVAPLTTAPAPARMHAAPAAHERGAIGRPLLPAALARALAFTALAAWGTLHWMTLLEPAEPGRGWLIVLVGVLAVGAMLAAGRLPGGWRVVVATAAIVPLAALMLLAGRVADELLLPSGWEALAEGIGRGIYDLPGVRVPYRGLDEWVRTVLPLGAAALVLAAALLAFWPRSRGRLGFPALALLLLTALFAVPIISLDWTAEFIRGAVFTLLMVAFLRLEKLRRPDALGAAVLAIGIVIVALAAAPALNKDAPWFDYESWALQSSSSKSTTFTWDHSYDGLNWPRDGRELLRVRAKLPAYWKAENLDTFDGQRWLRSTVGYAVPEFPNNPRRLRTFTQQIRVSIRNLRTDQFITAGYAQDVQIPRLFETQTADGLYRSPRTLRRGDTYTATVYTPRPRPSQRERVDTEFSPTLAAYTTIYTTQLGVPGAHHIRMTFPFFGDPIGQIEVGPPDDKSPEQMLAENRLTRTYALSQQLLEEAETEEDYVQAVLRYLGDESFTYTESPPPAARTLEGFLFDAKTGYCQQYSGAMALLLRMAGIPARVVTGFSTGATDTKTNEYVVRDFDAHSWVEAYYPGWGWITFDPTPAASPARSQPTDAASSGSSSLSSQPRFGDIPAERGAGVAVAGPSKPWWYWPVRVLAVLAVLALAALALRRWRRGAPPALTELERALRRTRRAPAPGTTLHALEQRFAATPAAAGYVRALRESRYAGAPIHPTRAQRRGLRSELRRGTGLIGHLRAWWALPPR
ncbi:MAG TPA: transglutaminaseTgpA domain-containing protein [Solirubrobacter sp.]|nr:transglutaminaseTgpA domain-containing protein [Solirubrobacter sp.]